MKNQIKYVALTTLIFCAANTALAQLPPAPDGSHKPKLPGEIRKPGKEALVTLSTISGTLTDFVYNDRNIYNAFRMRSGKTEVLIRFPEHMGEKLMQSVKPGTSISVTGFTNRGPLEENVFNLISVTSGDKVFRESPPLLPPVPPAIPQQENISGTISELKKDSSGTARALILDQKYSIDLPPHVAEQLQPMMQPGKEISISGFRIIPPAGVAMVKNMITIHLETITLKRQTYLVR